MGFEAKNPGLNDEAVPGSPASDRAFWPPQVEHKMLEDAPESLLVHKRRHLTTTGSLPATPQAHLLPKASHTAFSHLYG